MNNIQQKVQGKIPGEETGITVKQTICDICCPSFHCGIDAYVKEGQVIKIEGTKEHPTNKGLLCAKGLTNRQYIYRQDRLQTPMKRVGARGEGRFEEISWQEAYQEIAEKLLEIKEVYGPEAVMFYSGYSKWYRPYLHRLAYSFGSVNYGTESSNCMTSTFLNWLVTTGNMMCRPDIGKAGVFLGWAFNPYHSRYLASEIVEKRKQEGMKVVIIDPRITIASQRLADIHLRPKAGTDGLLALGIAHVLIREGLVDEGYIGRYVYGYEQYKDYVMGLDLLEVEAETGVGVEQIEEVAYMIGNHLPLAINESAAPIAHHKNGFQSYRAIMALSAITGSYDRVGGQIPIQFSYNYQAAGFSTKEQQFIEEKKSRSSREAVGSKRFPLWAEFIDEAQVNDLTRQIKEGKPYPIKAMVGFGLNHRIVPGCDLFKEAMMELDFIVNTDLFMTETSRFCDLLLPACSSFERSELKAYSGGYLHCTNPVIRPLYQSKSDVEIICDLAKAMELDDSLLVSGPEACYQYMISDLPIALEELRASKYPTKMDIVEEYIPGTLIDKGLNTDSGKFELYSNAIAKYRKWGLEPLPVYTQGVSAMADAQYSFQLCSGPRIATKIHSRLNGVSWVEGIQPYAVVDISIVDGEKLNIKQGDEVELFTDKGCITVSVNLTASVNGGTVYMFHGYPDAEVNRLVDQNHLDPYSGFPGFRSISIGIRKKGGDEKSNV